MLYLFGRNNPTVLIVLAVAVVVIGIALHALVPTLIGAALLIWAAVKWIVAARHGGGDTRERW